jgi:methionyl-tRNA formyltransferase
MNAGSPRLRTIFLGTPSFALPSLLALLNEVDLLAVVSQTDRPKGRGQVLETPPVAQVARERGIRLLQPPKLKAPDVLRALAEVHPDLVVTVAYGRIIPAELLVLPPRGCINLHPSLLPKYRGASPIQHAIVNGDAETGVTIMYQTAELDAGDIILQRRVPVELSDTAHTLEQCLATIGAEVLVEAVRLIGAGTAPRRPQDPAAATYVKKLTKDSGRIDWHQSAVALERFIRAMDPWPSAYTWHRGRLLKLWRGKVVAAAGRPGTIVEVRRGEGFVVAAEGSGLLVEEVQPEGRRRMSADEYVRGSHLEVGEELGAPGVPSDRS